MRTFITFLVTFSIGLIQTAEARAVKRSAFKPAVSRSIVRQGPQTEFFQGAFRILQTQPQRQFEVVQALREVVNDIDFLASQDVELVDPSILDVIDSMNNHINELEGLIDGHMRRQGMNQAAIAMAQIEADFAKFQDFLKSQTTGYWHVVIAIGGMAAAYYMITADDSTADAARERKQELLELEQEKQRLEAEKKRLEKEKKKKEKEKSESQKALEDAENAKDDDCEEDDGITAETDVTLGMIQNLQSLVKDYYGQNSYVNMNILRDFIR